MTKTKNILAVAALVLSSGISIHAQLALFEPPTGMYLGAWVDGTPVNGLPSDSPAMLNNRSNRLFSVYHFAQNIPGNSSSSNYVDTTAYFAQPQLDATTSDAILFLTVYPKGPNGLNVTDADINQLALQMQSLNRAGRRVMLRLAPEMNGSWNVWGQRPSSFIAFWKRVVPAVKAIAQNVAFVWSPSSGNGYPFLNGAYSPVNGSTDYLAMDTNGDGILDINDDPYSVYYPGDSFVDWVGLSIYYYGQSYPWVNNVLPVPGQTAAEIFGTNSTTLGSSTNQYGSFNFYQMFCVNRSKPFAASEYAAAFHLPATPAMQAAGIYDVAPGSSIIVATPLQSSYTSYAIGPGELAIKQRWWQQTLTNSTFLKMYPRFKLFNLFEFRKVEETTFRDFQVTNSSNPVVTNAFFNDLDNSGVKIVYANSSLKVQNPSSNTTVGGDGSGGANIVNSSADVSSFIPSSASMMVFAFISVIYYFM
ncbi:mannan endo-1,4-beta-mannosidase [Synchytrium microbalum]|uniref:Mannan endo-1,4-beta-mannosidase n=1 Tax=Synchytrium microbalum TaxID=1806994 RepID=A0A507CCU9_9FUNG|nr:mannan endo-1,4-beta-mannosidase [Synchytrium microbalum]TPX35363.1 mannan endo-1,4-beta-mannosidase [Synchytrium microbalum]